MHPEFYAKRMWASRQEIVAALGALASVTEQQFNVPASHADLKPNQAAPTDVQLLAITELVAELSRLVCNTVGAPIEAGAAQELP